MEKMADGLFGFGCCGRFYPAGFTFKNHYTHLSDLCGYDVFRGGNILGEYFAVLGNFYCGDLVV